MFEHGNVNGLGKIDKILILVSIAVNVKIRLWFQFNLNWCGSGLQIFPLIENILPKVNLLHLILIKCLHDVPLSNLHVL